MPLAFLVNRGLSTLTATTCLSVQAALAVFMDVEDLDGAAAGVLVCSGG